MTEEKFTVNGKVVYIRPSNSTFKKSAFQIKEEILRDLKKIGITDEYIDLSLPRNPLKCGEPAQISWVVNGKDFYFQCSKQERYVDNLGVISRVIEQESYAIRNGLKSFGQVMNQFRLGYDETGEKIKSPHDILGIPHSMKDIDYITFKYKQRAKELHPDNEKGDAEKFKELKEAYDQLKASH